MLSKFGELTYNVSTLYILLLRMHMGSLLTTKPNKSHLNPTEFQKLKEVGKTTEVDPFVKERKNKGYIVIKSK